MHTKRSQKIIVGTPAVDNANKKAIIQPSSTSTENAIIIFPYDPGNLYQIYATPLNVTDIQFQAGEQIISIAAGDTARWQVSRTASGADSHRTEHLLIKPLEEDLDTTMVVTSNMRAYHLLLKSTKNTFMATVQWQYQEDLDQSNADAPTTATSTTPPINFNNLSTNYDVYVKRGDTPDWMPKAVFNDGLKTYIEFPDRIQSAPALFIKQSGSGDAAVNYRVVGNYYVIDQVITAAELTAGNGATIVEINYKK
jgi:type IV secretion system protein VirB9